MVTVRKRYVGFQQFLFLSYFYFELVDFFSRKYITPNCSIDTRIDDLLTHLELDLDLWLEEGSSSGFDIN
jgi:hypothetical protein